MGQPALAFDRFDALATDIIADVQGQSFVVARSLIAMRLREMDLEARKAGTDMVLKRFDDAVARVKELA